MSDPQISRPGRSGPVLAFDTSGPWIMAGLAGAPCVIAGRTETMARGQAERLMTLLEEHLAAAGLGWRDLAGLGVGIGPGNFTGIRIAVAAARGLALGLGIPAIGVSQFRLVLDGQGEAGPQLVALPAPQDRAYVQLWQAGSPVDRPHVLQPGAAMDGPLPHGLQVIGHRAAEIAAGLGVAAGTVPHWQDRPGIDWSNRLAAIAAAGLASGATVPRPAPLYVRPADAAPAADPPPVILDA